jgi:hypothetical protein
LESVGELVQRHKKKAKLKRSEFEYLQSFMRSLPIVTINEEDYIRSDLFYGAVGNFREALLRKDSNLLFRERGLKTSYVASIEEFIDNDEFSTFGETVRPAVKQHIVNFFESETYKLEFLGTGAIGIGKDYAARIGMAYCLYLLSLLHNPQVEFGLKSGSGLYFIIQNKTEKLARKTTFNELRQDILSSKYFQKYFKPDKNYKSELVFPGNIYVVPFGGDDDNALGLNVGGFIANELNFMERIEKSSKTRWTGEEEYDQAEMIYTKLRRRMKSRLQVHGKLPGRIFLLSSSRYPGDFTDRKMQEAKKDDTIYVMKMTQAQSLSAEKFSGKMFYVERGNEYYRSYIMDDVKTMEEAIEKCKNEENVLEVNEEYRDDFEKDVDGAIRDFIGDVVTSKQAFIPYVEQLNNLRNQFITANDGNSLFYEERIYLDEFSRPDWEQIVNLEYVDEYLDSKDHPFCGHLDVGLNEDAAGLSIGHIVGYKLLPKSKVYDQRLGGFKEITDNRSPIYQADGSIEIVPRRSSRVDLELVRDLIIFIRGLIFLKWMTADTYQSVMLLTALKKAGIKCGTLSVDTNPQPYAELQMSIKEERFRYGSSIVRQQALALERHGEVVDHPSGGKKDVSDSAAGMVWLLQHKVADYRSGGSRRHKEPRHVTQHVDTRETRSDRRSLRLRRRA